MMVIARRIPTPPARSPRWAELERLAADRERAITRRKADAFELWQAIPEALLERASTHASHDPMDQGCHAPPWADLLPTGEPGPSTRMPISCRTGRECEMALAEKDFAASIHAMACDGREGGLWDHHEGRRPLVGDRDAKPENREEPVDMPRERAERYDHYRMVEYVQSRSWMPEREEQVYTEFWRHRRSYAEIGRSLGMSEHAINAVVLRLRNKLADWEARGGPLAR